MFPLLLEAVAQPVRQVCVARQEVPEDLAEQHLSVRTLLLAVALD
jgi:hypothetical protein